MTLSARCMCRSLAAFTAPGRLRATHSVITHTSEPTTQPQTSIVGGGSSALREWRREIRANSALTDRL